jgi:hypothetical protein
MTKSFIAQGISRGPCRIGAGVDASSAAGIAW